MKASKGVLYIFYALVPIMILLWALQLKFNICRVNANREKEKKMHSAFDQEIELKILDELEDK